MAKKVEILDLDINTSALIAKMTQTRTEIDRLKSSQKALAEQGKQNTDAFSKNEVELKRLQSSYTQQKNVVEQLTSSTNKFSTATEAISSALQTEINSISSARNNNTQLLRLRNELNLATEEGVKALNDINAKLNENNEFIKQNASAYEQQKINIGNYKESISEALGELNLFNGGIGGFIQRSQEAGGVGNLLKTSLAGAGQGFMGLTKASLSFIATPIGAVLAVLVGAFALIQSAMKRNEEATNKLKVAFASVTGIINSVLKALQPLGEFIIDGIVMGFELAGEVAEKTMGLIADGLDMLGFESASKGVKEFTNEIKAGVKEAQDLAKAEQILEASQRKSRLTQLQYQKDAEKFRQIRDDETKSIGERIKANDDLGKVLKQQLKDELAIANQALIVANLRIKAEGRTKETLDAQAQALTEIADIQERITGQESEQLVNRVALQKEANDKAKELNQKRIDEAIRQSKAEIDLYIAQSGVKKKLLEDELKFEEGLMKKKLALNEQEYKAGKKSKTEYEAEKLNIQNEYLGKQANLLVANADRELQIFKENIQKKIAEEGFFSQARLEETIKLNNELAQKERDNFLLKLQQGVINQTEYNDAINKVNEENRIANEDAEKVRKEAKKEQEAIDLENKRASEELSYSEAVELELQRNEEARLREVEQAEKTGASVALINAKYKQFETDINKKAEMAKLAMAESTLGRLAELLGENTAMGKAAALAMATINMYQGVTAELATKAVTPYEIGLKIANVAIVTATGLKNIQKIASTKTPKFADGGEVPTLQSGSVIDNGANLSVPLSNGDNTLAYVKQGEVILNKEQQRKAGGAMFFRSLGVKGFAGGGIVGGNTNIPTPVNGIKIDYDMLASAMASANQSLPAPVVSVQEFTNVSNRVKTIESGANF
ncbi:hypothetical protein B0I03_10551 [Flavobacterium aquaticum]|uniref:Uncharacterized protein n=1 Tax=Flavobacterium aquaticum TaxID=1236486 RepID=A0A327YUC2_9FLAO|nr:hypothetical protein [Flavobacterium aquaticum]RAK21619.1 hypothetical protein B0I03_10551 [Flavobacterium aquaticum]